MPKRRRGASLGRKTRNATAMQNARANRNAEQIQQDNTDARERMARLHQVQSDDARAERNEKRRLEQRRSRRLTFNRLRVNEQQRQQAHRSKVIIGAMDKECLHCNALKFKNEPAGMCCASGKVQLPVIDTPPEPLKGLQ